MFCLQKDGTATTYIEIITPISCIEIASCWQQENHGKSSAFVLPCSSLLYFALWSTLFSPAFGRSSRACWSSYAVRLRASAFRRHLQHAQVHPTSRLFHRQVGAWTKKQHETRQGGHDGFIPVPERTSWRSSDRFDSINSISIFSFCCALWKSLISCARHGVPSPSPAGTFRFFPRIPRL